MYAVRSNVVHVYRVERDWSLGNWREDERAHACEGRGPRAPYMDWPTATSERERRPQDESKIFALLNVGNPQIRGIDIALCMHGLKGKQPNQSNSHYQVTNVIKHVFALLE